MNLEDIKKEIENRAKTSGYDVDMERYKRAVDWLFDIKNKDVVVDHLFHQGQINCPDYFSLPKKISSNLTSDEIDLLQEFVPTELMDFYKEELKRFKTSSIKEMASLRNRF